jgi:hypothetical protein
MTMEKSIAYKIPSKRETYVPCEGGDILGCKKYIKLSVYEEGHGYCPDCQKIIATEEQDGLNEQ